MQTKISINFQCGLHISDINRTWGKYKFSLFTLIEHSSRFRYDIIGKIFIENYFLIFIHQNSVKWNTLNELYLIFVFLLYKNHINLILPEIVNSGIKSSFCYSSKDYLLKTYNSWHEALILWNLHITLLLEVFDNEFKFLDCKVQNTRYSLIGVY